MSNSLDEATSISVKNVATIDAVPEEGNAIVLYVRKLKIGFSISIEYRILDGESVETFCLLSKRQRTKKTAIRLAKDLAVITNSRSVYIIDESGDQ